MATNRSLDGFQVQHVNVGSICLDIVKRLADQNSATLGFLPYGAFDRLAENRQILAFSSTRGEVAGYVIFSTAKNRLKIAHLCVAEEFRGLGVAKTLLHHLKEYTSDLFGISVSCRRDYNLEEFWLKLGFVPKGERPGKAKEGSILTEWRLDYGKRDLFAVLAEQQSATKLCVVIDANIFYDLADERCNDDGSRESQALLSDWLSDDVEFCTTDEIYAEIDRNSDALLRERLKQSLGSRFNVLSHDRDRNDVVSQAMRKFFPENMSPSDKSDLAQISKTVTANIEIAFFITRDSRLLEEVEEFVYQKFGLRIIHPVEFIIQQDQLKRELAYQPIRLAGTSINQRKVCAGEPRKLIDDFLTTNMGETKVEFRAQIRRYLSHPENFDCCIIETDEGDGLLLFVVDRQSESELNIPIMRCKPGYLSMTLIRHCVFSLFAKAASEGRKLTRISEKYLDRLVIDALQEDGFFSVENSFIKIGLPVGGTLLEIARTVESMGIENRIVPAIASSISHDIMMACEEPDICAVVRLEKILYPVKFFDIDVPTFIIPIQPWWAKDLFDAELAEGILWGAKQELALNRTGVYYRSSKKTCEWSVPGRILWYVSSDQSQYGTAMTSAIRAVSFLDEIMIDRPKELYKRFRRLGVYTFQDVLKTAKNDMTQEVMALKFSDTQMFKYPVQLSQVQRVLDKQTTVPAPLRITSEEFRMIYNEGHEGNLCP